MRGSKIERRDWMRLWHKDLIPVLPRQQLLAQWRELCAIAKSIRENGTPNHILVNRIMDYPMYHLYNYASLVEIEMKKRGYKVDTNKFLQYLEPIDMVIIPNEHIFKNWHNERYLNQCYHNLEEKYDCGGISKEDWLKIEHIIINGES